MQPHPTVTLLLNLTPTAAGVVAGIATWFQSHPFFMTLVTAASVTAVTTVTAWGVKKILAAIDGGTPPNNSQAVENGTNR